MLATLIPLFNEKTEVSAYSLFAQRDNMLSSPILMGTASFDGASNIAGLEVIENLGIEVLSGDRDVIIELNQFSLISDVESICKVDYGKVIFLIDTAVTPTENNIDRIISLKSKGFRFAIRKLPIERFQEFHKILSTIDYIFLDHKKINVKNARAIFSKAYPNLKLVAVNVDTKEEYDKLTEDMSFDLYEGEFFRMPVKRKGEELAPMKITYIELLNIVNSLDFDLSEAADVIGHDTALVVSLLKMANRLSANGEITSIRHAAAMIGQRELKKWINSAVTKELCADKASEITRISLIRARFAENLAKSFELAAQDQELFLLGLFSVLDIILDKPMEEALDIVKVSKQIREALTEKKGPLAPVYDFMLEYEAGEWQEVSRLIIMNDMDMDVVYQAYIDALAWFKDLFS